ncbi:GDSL-type esterase/lipase family protein [Treponema sp. J25]|uniref:GDSL-type esterase/lipase family protein n=1 Tax=Treponema sp. J25 TaxID=2094121 RepID=UPI001FB57C01|nr:GDSL-type esterase/lipase family protein [Treponema sp. J25]
MKAYILTLLYTGMLFMTPEHVFSQKTSETDTAIFNREQVEQVEQKDRPRTTTKPILYLVGDSTVSSFKDPYYYPRYGYGTQLFHYFKDIEIVNLALSGRSSKSFIREQNYQNLIQNLKAGDFLLIGFGHNDEKPEEARYTNPQGSKEDPSSFKFYLYSYYIKLALDRGATPILCTPIVRRNPAGLYKGTFVHITEDKPGYPGGDYAESIRQLGKELGVTVLDLCRRTQQLYEALGSEKTLYLHAWITDKADSVDNTHLNRYGAAMVAFLLREELAQTNNPLKGYLLENSVTPSEHDFLTPNPQYRTP